MAFTSDNANVNHYPGTSKQACEDGCERSEMPPDNGTNNDGRLMGRVFDTCGEDTTKDSD